MTIPTPYTKKRKLMNLPQTGRERAPRVYILATMTILRIT